MLINARFLTRPATGVDRFAIELLGAGARLGLLPQARAIVPQAAALVTPPPPGLALARAGRDPEVAAALGQPLRAKPFPFGSINQFGDGGGADMVIRIQGPRGSGKLDVRARRSQGRWSYPRLQAELPGRHAPVDLRDERDRDCAILPGCR